MISSNDQEVEEMALMEELEERVQRGDPTPGAYSGGEPEPEVSDVGQAEVASLMALAQEFLAWINAKQEAGNLINAANADAQALDAKQADLHAQAIADMTENRRQRDPYMDMRMRHVEDLHADARRQQEQGFQQTQQVSLQAIQASLDLQKSVNSVMVKDLLDGTEGARVGRDRTWTMTEGFEAATIRNLEDAIIEAIRNTPMHPDKNQ